MKRKERDDGIYVTEIPIEDFDVAMDDFEGDEFVIAVTDATDEKEGSVSPINDFGIYRHSINIALRTTKLGMTSEPLYSRKLHMRVRRARTS